MEPLPEEVPLEELPDAPLDIPPAVVALADVKLMGDDYGGVWACTRSPARDTPGRARGARSPVEGSPGVASHAYDVTVERLDEVAQADYALSEDSQ